MGPRRSTVGNNPSPSAHASPFHTHRALGYPSSWGMPSLDVPKYPVIDNAPSFGRTGTCSATATQPGTAVCAVRYKQPLDWRLCIHTGARVRAAVEVLKLALGNTCQRRLPTDTRSAVRVCLTLSVVNFNLGDLTAWAALTGVSAPMGFLAGA